MARQDQAARGGFQGRQRDIGAVAAGDHGLVGLAAEVGEGAFDAHRADEHMLHQLIHLVGRAQHFGAQAFRKLAHGWGGQQRVARQHTH